MKTNRTAAAVKRIMLPVIFALVMMVTNLNVYASELDTNSVRVEVEEQLVIKSSQTTAVDHTFTFQLVSSDESNPMPDDAENGIYTFSLDSNQSGYFDLTFMAAGEYQYQIYQVTEESECFTYDTSVYTLHVYVTNPDSGLAVMAVITDEAGNKCESIIFNDIYDDRASGVVTEPEQLQTDKGTAVKTGDDIQMIQWVLLFILTMVILGTTAWRRRRRYHV